ncbi:MAG: hypothetical protein OXJ54_06850 [Gemmatimonadetes bacterium]|nr:hypothetical protein [Candidatus Palauibacter rhopaloidicola]
MTAPHRTLVLLVALVAIACDITDVAAPSQDNPDAPLSLMPEDRAQGLADQLNALGTVRLRERFLRFVLTPNEVQDMLVARYGQPGPWYEDRERDEERRGEENREGETAPAIARIVPQAIVESDSPREADLVLADEPLVRVGLLDGPDEYLFSNIEGGVRLEDGSIVVADEQSYEIRMFDARGRHVWTSGRQGQGPGEYGGVRLLRGCPGTAITVFDWHLDRVTRLDRDGHVIDTRALAGTGVQPYGSPTCSPDGDLVFVGWPDSEWDVLQRAAVGETYRWEMAVSWERDDGVVTLAEGIPGTERFRYGGGSGPMTWGRSLAFAATGTGVWYGSADDYELEHVDWTGRVTRIARWTGPDLEVTGEHLARYLEARLARYDTPAARRRFERQRWPEIRDDLPERLPAYERDGLLVLPDGSVWVSVFRWATPQRELHLLDPGGLWVRRVTIPARSTLLDAGVDWVLLLERGEFDEQRVAVYELVEGS